MRTVLPAVLCACCVNAALRAQSPAPPAPTPAAPPSIASPASQKPPATKVVQTFAPELIQAGRSQFASQCGFCHGRDTQGGESGPDLTRSSLVADDVRGDKLGPFLRAGRPDKGMPAFSLSDGDLAAVVAFIHDEKSKAESETGGRRTVEPADLRTGNAEAGKRYFNGAGGCARCHSATGDLATIGSRYQGLPLLHRMLYPGSGQNAGSAPTPPTLSVKTASGETVTGKLARRDEFTITLTDAAGWQRTWPLESVTVSGDEPLRAHADQLPKYTDEDIHNLIAYLETLR
jgi:cytochrome c oxidase cbb3-type subunit III